jgi:hypothetical protein
MHKSLTAIGSLAMLFAIACLPAQTQLRESVVARRAALAQPSNLTHTLERLGGPGAGRVITAFAIPGDGSNGSVGTIQPGVGVLDERSGETVTDAQINLPPRGSFTTATSSAGHDAPSIARTANDDLLVIYGAASTYKNYGPPSSWRCQGTYFCEPFKFASGRELSAGGTARALAASPEYLLPSIGLSEASSATIGDATIIAGQEQVSSATSVGGPQGYVTLHAGEGGYFDTTAGRSPLRAGDTAGDGLQTITRSPEDDALASFRVSGTGSGHIALDNCEVALTADSPAAATQIFVASFERNAPPGCLALRSSLTAVATSNDALLPGSVVGLAVRSGNARAVPLPTLRCDGGFVCGSPRGAGTLLDERGTGIHRHFLWGGVARAGAYVYDLLDVQQEPLTWYARGHNSLALALACFRSSGPRGGRWTWTDCAGNHPFEVAPGVRPQYRLGTGAGSARSPYLVGPPRGGYADGMVPFIYDYGMRAQPSSGDGLWPVISAESLTQTSNGHLIIAYDCNDREHDLAICYVELDPATAQTLRAGFIERPHGGGALAAIALAAPKGQVALGALAADGSRYGCTAASVCALRYDYDGHGGWRRTVVHEFPGGPASGFPGSVAASADGSTLFYSVRQRTRAGAQIDVYEAPAD